MSYVSAAAVKQAEEELVVNRETRRRIQQMTTKELGAYLIRVYRRGFEDGADAIDQAMRQEEEECEEVQADWSDVLRIISEVKGIGPKLTQAIDNRFKEAF